VLVDVILSYLMWCCWFVGCNGLLLFLSAREEDVVESALLQLSPEEFKR
jgi:hypothetical protein